MHKHKSHRSLITTHTQMQCKTYHTPCTSTSESSPVPCGRSWEYLRILTPRTISAHPSNSSPLAYTIPPHDSPARRQFLFDVLKSCTPDELIHISSSISALLRRDFLYHLPTEVAFRILGFIDDFSTLAVAAEVSKHWYTLIRNEVARREKIRIQPNSSIERQ
ncbi:hypothetical protein JOM56_007940 [Amanita muscaria]